MAEASFDGASGEPFKVFGLQEAVAQQMREEFSRQEDRLEALLDHHQQRLLLALKERDHPGGPHVEESSRPTRSAPLPLSAAAAAGKVAIPVRGGAAAASPPVQEPIRQGTSESALTAGDSPSKRDSKDTSDVVRLDVHRLQEAYKQEKGSTKKTLNSNKKEISGVGGRVAGFIQTRTFEYTISGVIMLNAVLIGVQTDWRMKNVHAEVPLSIRTGDLMFSCAFTLELLLRMVAEGRTFFYRRNMNCWWNAFDSLLVLSAWIEEILSAYLSAAVNMNLLRVLRIVRLVRVVRIIRVMRFFKELRLMVAGIMGCGRALLWACWLLFIIIYIHAVFVMQVASAWLLDVSASDAATISFLEENFDTIARSVYTLYKTIIGGVSWGEIADPLLEVNMMLVPVFVLYTAFAIFCVLNIITGVFVESAHNNSHRDEDRMIIEAMESKQRWMDSVKKLFESVDENGSGEIKYDDFVARIGEIRNQVQFQQLDIDLDWESAREIFTLFDFEGDGTINLEEFARGIHEFHGQAKSIDIARLRHDTRKIKEALSNLQERVGAH